MYELDDFDIPTEEDELRETTWMDRLANTLSSEVINRSETYIEKITLGNLFSFFLEKRLEVEKCEKCLLLFQRNKKGEFIVTQILLDGEANPLKKTRGAYLGRRIVAKSRASDVIDYMKGEKSRVMEVPE